MAAEAETEPIENSADWPLCQEEPDTVPAAFGDELDANVTQPADADGLFFGANAEVGRGDSDADAEPLEDFEADGANAGYEDAALEATVQEDEAWVLETQALGGSCSERERELWSRARHRALRRERAEVQAMKFPNATVQRLVRVHPHMQMRTAEALDVLNLSAVILLQGLARSAARGSRRPTRVQFEDVRQACAGAQELQFMQPLSSVLDPSALTVPRGGEPADDAAEAPAAAAGRRRAPTLATGAGQSRLGAAAFARGASGGDDSTMSKAAEDGDVAAAKEGVEGGYSSAGEQTPARKAPTTAKRKAPSTAEKKAAKAPRTASGRKAAQPAAPAATGGGAGLLGFFRRAGGADAGGA
eukprot:TRINITY_DN14256_c0_g2_i1.p1 TRINITY_DN14256_c0_g2~~TRINITY_DN14256_c0_g2_i1.p1  ORF type:complete len:389 (-),score=102.95 TRINITY_DN14256_c0_g2_i1:58-1134(-)